MNIAIIGMGLIGGSLGRAIVKKTTHKVFGYDLDASVMLKAELMLACHEQLTDNNIKDMDLVLFAVRPAAAIASMRDIAGKLKNGAIVLDCCGTKRTITSEMRALSERYPLLQFIGGHPMAGREYSGISHSTPGLFEKAYMLITPVSASIEARATVKALFKELGCEDTIITTPEKHDKIIAYTSQLAHVVSSAYVKSPTAGEHAGFSAGSFRDLTRVAKLDPAMWTELFLDDADNLINELDILLKNLSDYREAIANRDAVRLETLLSEGVQCKEAAEQLRKERANK
jgi:prephenate dehydrogenase